MNQWSVRAALLLPLTTTTTTITSRYTKKSGQRSQFNSYEEAVKQRTPLKPNPQEHTRDRPLREGHILKRVLGKERKKNHNHPRLKDKNTNAKLLERLLLLRSPQLLLARSAKDRRVLGVGVTMVGVVRDIIIPVKGGGGQPLFTIVCEVLPVPAPSTLQDPPPLTRLWKVAR